jgi:hypothetical protein
MLLRMSLNTDSNSFAGPPMRLSISSSSGVIKVFISSNMASYLGTFCISRSASGYLPVMLISPWIGWNTTAKWEANPAPDVNRALDKRWPVDVIMGFRKAKKSQPTIRPRMGYSIRT